MFFAQSPGGDHGEDRRNVFGAGATAVFLFATHEQGTEHRRDLHEADADGTAELVGAAGDKIAFAEAGGGKFADPLRGIAGKRNIEFAAEFDCFAPGLENASFVVCSHDCDNCRR